MNCCEITPPPPPLKATGPSGMPLHFSRLHFVTFLTTIILKITIACSDVPELTPRTRVLLQKLGVPICKDATNCPLRNLSLVYTPLTPTYRYSCLSTARQAIYCSTLQSGWVIFMMFLFRKITCYKPRTGHWSSSNAFSCILQPFQANVAEVTKLASVTVNHSLANPIIRRYTSIHYIIIYIILYYSIHYIIVYITLQYTLYYSIHYIIVYIILKYTLYYNIHYIIIYIIL
jgi:hypothetical protein